MQIYQIQGAKNENKKFLFKKDGVKSVGIGYKIVDGKVTDELCMIVGVKEKKPFSKRSRNMVPQSVDGIPTDVVEVGTPVAQVIDPTKTHRPIFPGISIGHKDITAGTFGCVVYRDGEPFILSNNHVLANSNSAEIGDEIYQPGPVDGGNASLQAGTLEDFVTLNYGSSGGGDTPPTCGTAKAVASIANFFARLAGSSHRLQAVKKVVQPVSQAANLVDAAIARPTVALMEEIAEIGKPVGIREAELGMDIQKFGRTTSYTTSKISQLYATVQVSYGSAGVATFEDQIITGNMSAGGDSGSAVLDMDKNLVGLLFAGSTSITILNPIQAVFNALNLSL